jgi:asparagine N-glycosylation enzyme membrane subunit Stt3
MLAAQSSPVSGFVFVVAVLATSIVLVAALAWVSRQLLGLPVGTLRAFIAGLLGFVAAYLLGRSLQAAEPGHAVAFFTVVLGVPLIVAMIVIVAAEVLVPTGTGPGPLEVIRGVRSAFARFRRYWQISRIAARHGLALTCAGDAAGRTPPAGRQRSGCRCGVPWKRAGLPSPSWASCCPLAVICSRRSSFPSSPGSRTGPSRRCGSKWRR